MLSYFLQVNVCWLLFYAAYYILLSKETFFHLNRIWLIASLLCGLILPLVADYFTNEIEPVNLVALTLKPLVVTAKDFQHNLTNNNEGILLRRLAWVYMLGVMVLAIRFLAGLFFIFKLFLQSPKKKKSDFILIQTQGNMPPFSFFNLIFINPKKFETIDFQQIMQHELTHVRQRHSFDVLFMELINIAFWGSPVVYFYKLSLRNVHEYLADRVVLRTNPPPQYGRLLLRQQQSGVVVSLTSNISNHFFSQLKKRILMMTRNKSKRTALIKYTLAVPIFLILTTALASPKMPLLAKTEVLGDKIITSLDNFDKENSRKFANIAFSKDIFGVTSTSINRLPIAPLLTKQTGRQQKNNLSSGSFIIVPPQYKSQKDTVPTNINPDDVESMSVDKNAINENTIKIKMKNGVLYQIEGEEAKLWLKEVEKNERTKSSMRENKNAVSESDNPSFTEITENPQFIGGQDSLFRWLGQSIQYPPLARQKQVEGTVFVGFVVEKDGSISNVKVKREPQYPKDTIKMTELNGMQGVKLVNSVAEGSLGREAVRVISAMPKWKPATNNGLPVRVAYTMPIAFRLE